MISLLYLCLVTLMGAPLWGVDEPVCTLDPEGAQQYNRTLSALRAHLYETFERASALARSAADEGDYQRLLSEMQKIKKEIRSLEEGWRKTSVEEGLSSDEVYAFWDVGEITLSQLIMEYGATDYLYVIPQELGGMK